VSGNGELILPEVWESVIQPGDVVFLSLLSLPTHANIGRGVPHILHSGTGLAGPLPLPPPLPPPLREPWATGRGSGSSSRSASSSRSHSRSRSRSHSLSRPRSRSRDHFGRRSGTRYGDSDSSSGADYFVAESSSGSDSEDTTAYDEWDNIEPPWRVIPPKDREGNLLAFQADVLKPLEQAQSAEKPSKSPPQRPMTKEDLNILEARMAHMVPKDPKTYLLIRQLNTPRKSGAKDPTRIRWYHMDASDQLDFQQFIKVCVGIPSLSPQACQATISLL
jgi:hypothetical protein